MNNDITAIMKEHVARLEKELDTMCSQFKIEKPVTIPKHNLGITLPAELVGKIKGAIVEGKINKINETVCHVLNGFIKQLEKEQGFIEPVDPKMSMLGVVKSRKRASKEKKMYTMVRNMAKQIRQLKEMYLEGE